MKKKSNILIGAGFFVASVALAVLLLLLGTLLPQGPIEEHIAESAQLISQDNDCWPRIFDGTKASTLDNFTDAIMMMEASLTNSSDVRSIFTNPYYLTGVDTVSALVEYSEGNPPELMSYARYWLGFRWLLRLELVFFSYAQIRRFMAALFFSLLTLNVFSVSSNTSPKFGVMLAFSMILMRMNIICFSMQFICCFTIAFIAMLFVPALYRHIEYDWLFFFGLGIATMYFDFYSVPLLTAGLPMLYLYLISEKRGERLTGKRLFRNFAVWFLGYVLMWLAKLALTTAFTPYNTIDSGLSSMSSWVGITDGIGTRLGDFKAAAVSLGYTVFSDAEGAVVIALLLAVFAAVIIALFGKKLLTLKALKEHLPLLVFILVPAAWFIIAPKPMIKHSWFQYRTLAMIYWTLGSWLCLACRDIPEDSRLRRFWRV